MQRIVLPQSVFSLPTSIVGSAEYYTNQWVCNPSRGLKQSLVFLSLTIADIFRDPSLHPQPIPHVQDILLLSERTGIYLSSLGVRVPSSV